MSDSRTGASTRRGDGEVSPLAEVLERNAQAAFRRLQEERRRDPERFQRPDESRSEGRLRREMVAHGVPTRYTEAEWDQVAEVGLLEWKAPDILRARLDRGRGLMLLGPVGTGKSSIAALVCGETLRLGRSVRWETVGTLIDELGDAKLRADAMRRCRYPDLLVLDDFGVGALSPWQIESFDKIVESRYRNRKSMIVTGNVTPQTLANDPGLARMVDRWRQVQTSYVIGGSSRRKAEE